MADTSKIIRSEHFTWPHVERKNYKDGASGYQDISRYTLLGEQDDEQGLNFQTRYFEIAENGYSSLERHRHPHTVIIVRGRGSMILGETHSEINLMDTIYIASGTVHQFHADRGECLGFLCVVDRYRDRPEIPSGPEELADWIPDPAIRQKARI